MFLFDPPENFRKPKVFWCFQGDQKKALGRKGLILVLSDWLRVQIPFQIWEAVPRRCSVKKNVLDSGTGALLWICTIFKNTLGDCFWNLTKEKQINDREVCTSSFIVNFEQIIGNQSYDWRAPIKKS